MKKSIRTKIAFLVIAFAMFVVATAWIICNYLVSGVFYVQLKHNLQITYDSCNQLFNSEDMIDKDTGALLGGIQNPVEAIVFIFDDKNERVYTTISNKSQMMQSMYNMIDSI